MPYLTDAGSGCGENFVNPGSAGTLDGISIVGGHEYAEVITDQFPNGGWLDTQPNPNENGDLCSWIQGPSQGASRNLTLATGTFAVQSTWANDFNGGTGGCLVSHPIIASPAITSASAVTFVAGTPGTFTITTTNSPTASISATGSLPAGVVLTDNNNGTATLAGTAALGRGGTYPLTVIAANGVGSAATQSFTLIVNDGPVITSAAATTFTVGVAGSLLVTTSGLPAPTITETGTLPSGVTFSSATRTLSGAPAQGSVGNYPVTFGATNGIGTPASQNFTLTVNQAAMTYPTDGQSNVDTTLPFTWSTIPQAQAYLLLVGTTIYGADLVNSGILASSRSSFSVPALPTSGPPLHATLFTEVNGGWTYQAVSFTAAPGQGTFTFPQNGQTGVDPTKAFTWATIPQAQAYLLIVGTSQYGSDVAISSVLPPAQSSYATPTLPAGRTLFASLFTKVNGAFTRVQSITFTAGLAQGLLTFPTNGQRNVPTPTTFTWSTIAGAQGYYLVVGTAVFGFDLVNSGTLPPTQSSFSIAALPHGPIIFVTLFTRFNNAWVPHLIAITAS
ncbi:MAG: Ig domain-containing protein [Actinomycetota bacterium]|nr:Ig domain-containing protein [Actinomycetota bacterium]